MTNTCKCIDISHHQGSVDFERVAADGVIAMIHKATQGTGNIDDLCNDNVAAARKAGIVCCTYHFLEHGNIEAQMQHYLDTVDPVEGERVVIDWEDWPGHSTVTANDLLQATEYLLADSRKLQVTVYGSESKFIECLSDLEFYEIELLNKTDLWVAHYGVDAPEEIIDDIWPTWKLFQYSDQGSIDGIDSAAVDLNEFNGSDAELIKWISPAQSGRRPRPSPQPDNEVIIHITVPEGILVSVFVNDDNGPK